ncbi:YgiQ family radical SAM protein [Spirochaeta cellobiosiphila]|uniref:YgiQ family radical SAM protein n=1 Tax=Spirochaeta cellobiosiphila TaxID=504483 RepID=UPI001B7FC099|nr:YgiQ family radical SAM protein [Spirochaeta cellobiosiphila]
MNWFPTNITEMSKLGWTECDFIFISGDAYVDHPSFATALLSRWLEAHEFKVGILAQPDINDIENFRLLGRPKYGFLINSGNMDSMVNHYTANKRLRRSDSYTPDGQIGKRPDRAIIRYTTMAKQAYKNIPTIIGGIESSLRRFSHYDYWSDKVRKSILLDSKASLLVYGMAEYTLLHIANRLRDGQDINDLIDIPGTVYRQTQLPNIDSSVLLPSFEEVTSDKRKYAESTKIQYYNQDPIWGKTLIEQAGSQYVVQNPPSIPLKTKELDKIYNLKYFRLPHPCYGNQKIPALNEVKFSLTRNRGCYGSCSFCAIVFHQGKIVQTRSDSSLQSEVDEFVAHKDFKGVINDVGGPTANFTGPSCDKQLTKGTCYGKNCLYPTMCKHIKKDNKPFIQTLTKLRNRNEVKKVYVRSGIRYDYLKDEMDSIRDFSNHHISGQLKVAPEHCSKAVLDLMGKPSINVYNDFKQQFTKINTKKKQYLIPYFISSHPGSTLEDALELALFLKSEGFVPDQVQDFYPTPGTISTCMYFTGIDPISGKSIHIPKGDKERKLQRALLQFHKKENKKLVIQALKMLNRRDLIGNGSQYLISPGR